MKIIIYADACPVVDTFWKAYIPDDLDFSPYEDRMINSLCHAWSCTPSYFIRKYGL